MNLRKDQSKG